MSNKKRICAFLLLTAVLLSGCTSGTNTEEVPSLMEPVGVKVDTAVVERGDFCTKQMYEGSVVAHAEELAFEIDGVLGSVDIYQGQWVEEGDPLFYIDQEDLKEEIEDVETSIAYTIQDGEYTDAMAMLDIEQLELELEKLCVAEIRDDAAIEAKQLDIEAAKLKLKQNGELRQATLDNYYAKLDSLKTDYGRNVIYAPFSGNVFYESLTEGTKVKADKPVAYIANPNDFTLIVDEYLSEQRLETITYYGQIGGTIYELKHIPMEQEEMSSIILSGESLTTEFEILGDLSEVTAGMYGVLFTEFSYVEDALYVPMLAVYSAGTSRYVYMVNEDGSRTRRDIKVGKNNGIVIQVLEGLEEGDEVYVKE